MGSPTLPHRNKETNCCTSHHRKGLVSLCAAGAGFSFLLDILDSCCHSDLKTGTNQPCSLYKAELRTVSWQLIIAADCFADTVLCGYFGFSWVFLNERKWHRVLSSQPLVRCCYICRRIRPHLCLFLPCWCEDLGLSSGPHSALRQFCHWCEKEPSTFPVWSPNTPDSIRVPV